MLALILILMLILLMLIDNAGADFNTDADADYITFSGNNQPREAEGWRKHAQLSPDCNVEDVLLICLFIEQENCGKR